MTDQFHPGKCLPDCMMPDGGECCPGYVALYDAYWHLMRGAHAQRAPNHGNALTDVGPDFRVVSVRVLQSAYDRIDAMLASIEPDLRAANSVRIELRHLINERHTGAAVTSTECGGDK